jgi:EpsI family protein
MKKLIIVLLLLIPFGAMATVLRYMVVEPKAPSDLESIPLDIGKWKGEKIPIDQATATSLKATDAIVRSYTDGENDLSLFIAYFRDQKYGSQIHSPRHCLPGGGWVVSDLERVPFNLGDEVVTVNRMRISKLSQRQQMYYWFHTRSGNLCSEYSLKFDLVRNSLLLRPTDAIIIRITVFQGNKSAAESQQLAERFAQELMPSIRAALPFSTL